jgi:hypothetical protein
LRESTRTNRRATELVDKFSDTLCDRLAARENLSLQRITGRVTRADKSECAVALAEERKNTIRTQVRAYRRPVCAGCTRACCVMLGRDSNITTFEIENDYKSTRARARKHAPHCGIALRTIALEASRLDFHSCSFEPHRIDDFARE